jgi:hypothetical protein
VSRAGHDDVTEFRQQILKSRPLTGSGSAIRSRSSAAEASGATGLALIDSWYAAAQSTARAMSRRRCADGSSLEAVGEPAAAVIPDASVTARA